jgi:hypothetical protein
MGKIIVVIGADSIHSRGMAVKRSKHCFKAAKINKENE